MIDQSVNQQLQPRPKSYVAPSWSWASTKNSVCFGHGAEESLIMILECRTALKTRGYTTGQVESGTLRLKGFPRKIYLRQERDKAYAVNVPLATGDVVGMAWLDADEKRPETLWCLRWREHAGLLLAETDEGCFRRVGYCDVIGREQEDAFISLFRGSLLREELLIL